MERKKKEKCKSYKLFNHFNITPKKQKQVQNKDASSKIQSHDLGYLIELDFDEKIKQLFDSKKFTLGNQFDQKGSEKFLDEKDECLKYIELDDTILDTKNKNSKNKRRKSGNKCKKELRKLSQDLKYIPRVEIPNEKIESFFSTESGKQIVKEFVSK